MPATVSWPPGPHRRTELPGIHGQSGSSATGSPLPQCLLSALLTDQCTRPHLSLTPAHSPAPHLKRVKPWKGPEASRPEQLTVLRATRRCQVHKKPQPQVGWCPGPPLPRSGGGTGAGNEPKLTRPQGEEHAASDVHSCMDGPRAHPDGQHPRPHVPMASRHHVPTSPHPHGIPSPRHPGIASPRHHGHLQQNRALRSDPTGEPETVTRAATEARTPHWSRWVTAHDAPRASTTETEATSYGLIIGGHRQA